MTNILLQLLFIIASIFFVFLFISLGWYMVWKFFLCRFRLVRELFSLNSLPPPEDNISSSSKSSKESSTSTSNMKPVHHSKRSGSSTKVKPTKID